MNFNEIWALLEPYILPIFEGGVISAIVALLAKSALNAVSQKWANKLDISNVADKVASKLVSSSLNVDLTSITEKQIKASVRLLEKSVVSEIASLKDTVAKQNETLCIVGELLANKTTTSAKKEQLIAYLSNGNGNVDPIVEVQEEAKETIAITLEPLPYDVDEEEQEVISTDETDSEEVISFG